MFERILEQNCQTFDNFNFEFSMSHHNAHYQPYKKAPAAPLLPAPHPHHGGEGHLAGRTPLVACREQHVQPGSDLHCADPAERLSA